MARSLLFTLLSFLLFQSCISYSFSEVSKLEGSIQVKYFENQAVTSTNLASFLTQKLNDKINNETKLVATTITPDYIFEGVITGYGVSSLGVQTEAATKNQLTITLEINFIDNINPDNSFKQRFSQPAQFDASENVSDVENDLIEEISEALLEQVFNKAFTNW